MHKHFRSTTAAAAAPRSTRWIPPASQRLAVIAALVFTAAWLAWPALTRRPLPTGRLAGLAGVTGGLALCWVTIRLRPNSQSPDPHFESNLSRTTLAPHSLSDDSDDTHVKTAPVGPVDL